MLLDLKDSKVEEKDNNKQPPYSFKFLKNDDEYSDPQDFSDETATLIFIGRKKNWEYSFKKLSFFIIPNPSIFS